MLTRKKKIVFSLIPTLLVAALLILAELALRLFVPSLESSLAVDRRYDGRDWLQINRRYLERYFPGDIVLLPEFKPTLFTKEKGSRTFRVFCLGESSMFGTPYQMNATIPAILRTQLRRLAPGRDIEVVNLGASAINTNVLADIAPQVAAFRPDLVIVYTGHNEFYGPDGVGAAWLEKQFSFLTRWKYWLRDLRIYRGIQRVFARDRGETAGDRNLMKIVSRGASVPLDSDDAERVFRQFERNLREVILPFRRDHIPVIISDVSSNLLFPPFAPEHTAGFGNIRQEFAQTRFDQLIPRLESAVNTDAGNALLTYWLGRCYLSMGQADTARVMLERARDLDLLKFRAPRRINAIIRKAAAEEGIPCVSTDSLFRAVSPAGIPGENIFWEHLHPNAYGYYQIADLFLKSMIDLDVIPLGGEATDPFARRIPYDPDSLAIPWLDLAYADLSMEQLTRRWPFDNYAVQPMVLPKAGEELQKIAADVYTRKLMWDDGCYRSALAFRNQGNTRAALTTYRALVEDYPYNAYARYLAATIYKDEGQYEEAEHEYASSISINPDYPFARIDLGLLLINAGRFDEAITHLSAALRMTEGKGAASVRASALYGLSAAYANKEEMARALDLVNQSLALAPEYKPAQELRAGLTRRIR